MLQSDKTTFFVTLHSSAKIERKGCVGDVFGLWSRKGLPYKIMVKTKKFSTSSVMFHVKFKLNILTLSRLLGVRKELNLGHFRKCISAVSKHLKQLSRQNAEIEIRARELQTGIL